VFLSKRNSVGCGCHGLPTEIGREKNLIELGHTLLLADDIGPNREDGTKCLPEYLLGDGAHHQFPGAGATMSANHNQVNVMFADKLGEYVPDIAYPEKRFVRYAPELRLQTGVYFLFAIVPLVEYELASFPAQ